tara:strand:+ start:39 stop:1028 length:990 start_codon:yes stop_codon:yes gene_type:complete
MKKIILKYFILFINQSSILVGGQAVIEGVLMRVPGAYATAVRDPQNNIVIDRHDFKSVLEKYNLKNIIILRGVIGLFESLKIGFKTLQWSADIAEQEEENQTNPIIETLLTILSIMFVITLFFIGPLSITRIIIDENSNPFGFNIIAGLIRITFFLIYLIAISRMKDVYTLFQYHGAEHKTVYNFESGKKLAIQTAQSFPTQHPRCGTSFVFIIMIIGILTFTVIDSMFLAYFLTMDLIINPLVTRVITHILLMPLVAGFGYEVLKITAKYKDNIIFKLLAAPGLWLQNITTKQPDDSQLEVAIAALKSAFGDSIVSYEGKKHIAEAIE